MTTQMIKLVFFLAGGILLLTVSWRSLRSHRNHGFFRFFAWLIMLGMLVYNLPFWFRDPFSWHQIMSWILLVASVFPLADSLYRFRQLGRIRSERQDPALFGFEKTTRLITTGVFRYIRHPMYASLLYLTWGIALKNPDPVMLICALAATIFLWLTVKTEETENIAWFGEEYRTYMTRTRRFIPLIW